MKAVIPDSDVSNIEESAQPSKKELSMQTMGYLIYLKFSTLFYL